MLCPSAGEAVDAATAEEAATAAPGEADAEVREEMRIDAQLAALREQLVESERARVEAERRADAAESRLAQVAWPRDEEVAEAEATAPSPGDERASARGVE